MYVHHRMSGDLCLQRALPEGGALFFIAEGADDAEGRGTLPVPPERQEVIASLAV